MIADKVFIVALKDLCQQIEDLHEIRVKIHNFNTNQKIPQSLEVGLFRILQELLANIIKHAKAENVEIHVNFYDDSLNIIVEDDGVGFDIEEIGNNGMGLSGIKKRLEGLKGNMQIDTRINRGTTIILDLKL
jgi:signal transduction histidine kinase